MDCGAVRFLNLGEPAAPHPAIAKVGSIILDAVADKKITHTDLLYLAAVLEVAGIRANLPAHPRESDDVGWLEVRPETCGRKDCHCMKGGALHGPYVTRVWREGGRKKKERLGPLGKARAPKAVAPRLREQIAQLNRVMTDTRFFIEDP